MWSETMLWYNTALLGHNEWLVLTTKIYYLFDFLALWINFIWSVILRHRGDLKLVGFLLEAASLTSVWYLSLQLRTMGLSVCGLSVTNIHGIFDMHRIWIDKNQNRQGGCQHLAGERGCFTNSNFVTLGAIFFYIYSTLPGSLLSLEMYPI